MAELLRRSGRDAGLQAPSDPALWEIVFPDGGVADKARVGYRLTRVLKFRRGSPWLGTMNGIGVVVFPLATNSISGATLTFKTEKLVPGKRGKRNERIVTRKRTGSITLPGPEDPHATPEQIRSSLGMQRPPR